MASCLDRIIQDIDTRFEQIQELSKRFALTPSILLNPAVEVDLSNAPEEIDRGEFDLERKRHLNFVAVSEDNSEIVQGGSLELLTFIHRYKSIDTVPNIELGLRIFLTIGVSIAKRLAREAFRN